MEHIKTYEGWKDRFPNVANSLSAFKGNVKTEINAHRLKVGDILCANNPKDMMHPTLTIVLEKYVNKSRLIDPGKRERKVYKVFDTGNDGCVYPNQTPEYVARGKKIYKIENIGDDNIEFMLTQMTNEAWRISMYKELLDNIFDIWSKRCPKAAEILDDINMKKEAEKYNI